MAGRRTTIQNRELLRLVAAALGESPSTTTKRGASVSNFMAGIFESNPHAHRAELSVLCARIGVSTLTLDTLGRRETYEFLINNPNEAKQVLVVLQKHQEIVDYLKDNCTKALTREDSQRCRGIVEAT